jgi:undecaprenyl-diphosphatase
MFDFLLQIDYWILTQINSVLCNSYFDWFFPLITDLNKNIYFKILAPLTMFVLFFWKFKRKGILAFIALLLSVGVSDFTGGRIKHWPKRERPFQNSSLQVIQRSRAGGYSFYSNHASNMFAFAGFSAAFAPALAPVFYGVAFAVAYSRIYN